MKKIAQWIATWLGLCVKSNEYIQIKKEEWQGLSFPPMRKGKDKFIRGLDGGNLKEIKTLDSLDLDWIIKLKFTLNKIRWRGLDLSGSGQIQMNMEMNLWDP